MTKAKSIAMAISDREYMLFLKARYSCGSEVVTIFNSHVENNDRISNMLHEELRDEQYQ